MENWESCINQCNEALKIDPTNSKALFRRATALEQKKDYAAASQDLQIAAKSAPADKGIKLAEERVKRAIAKEKAKEKKMWGKAFA